MTNDIRKSSKIWNGIVVAFVVKFTVPSSRIPKPVKPNMPAAKELKPRRFDDLT